MRARWLIFVIFAGACDNDFLPVSYVHGLRVLAVQADPPEIAAGEMSRLVPLVIDTNAPAPALTYEWAACLLPSTPAAGGTVNRDCLGAPPELVPLGSGGSATVTMPAVTPDQLGIPDATLGLYLPVRLVVSESGSSARPLLTFYRLRYALGTPPNHNPHLTGIFQVTSGAAPVALDPAAPPTLHAGDALTLRVQFSDDSDETYLVLDPDHPDMPKSQVEQLRVSWFATAGSFEHDVTGQSQPDTIFRLDKRLPSTDTIDLWAVAIDERGGSDWLHESLKFGR